MRDDLRDRLGKLADEATPELSDAARRRVVESMRRDGPDFVHAARQRRRVMIGVGVSALAAAAAVAFALAPPPPEPTANACMSWTPAEANRMGSRLDLGARGAVTVEGTVSLEAPDPCTTILHLDEGRVDVRADDLGGGLLRVAAGPVAVEVWGTRFSVTRHDGEVSVEVEEGHVVVTAPENREIHLRDGERWSLGRELAMAAAGDGRGDGDGVADRVEDGDGVGRGDGLETNWRPAAPAHHDTSAAAARADVPPPAPAPGALLGEAESLWREGQHEAARRIFRQVGRGHGAVAEAAWIRLARLELRAGDGRGALRALSERARRFAEGRLDAEALFLEADAHGRLGEAAARARAIDTLQSRHPSSPQARAVARESETGAE